MTETKKDYSLPVKSYYILGKEYETIEEFVKIIKLDPEQFPFEEVNEGFITRFKYNSKRATPPEKFKELYDTLPPMSHTEALNIKCKESMELVLDLLKNQKPKNHENIS